MVWRRAVCSSAMLPRSDSFCAVRFYTERTDTQNAKKRGSRNHGTACFRLPEVHHIFCKASPALADVRPCSAFLYNAAVMHPSLRATYNYQRLEFLGDSVLHLVAAQFLYNNYTHAGALLRGVGCFHSYLFIDTRRRNFDRLPIPAG